MISTLAAFPVLVFYSFNVCKFQFIRHDRGQTPLHFHQGVETCRLLLDSKADVAAKDKKYDHDVFFLFMRRSVTAAHPFPLFVYKSPSPSEQTALHHYLEFQGSMFLHLRRDDLSAIFETCRLLLDSKADVAAKDSRFCRRSWFFFFRSDIIIL